MQSCVLLVLALVLVAPGCRSRSALPSAPVALQSRPPSALPPDASIELLRAPCHGRCPVYALTISGDGTVRYRGLMHVRVKGPHTKRVAASEVSQLFEDILGAGFLTWRDKYETPATDLEGARLTLTYATRRKSVDDYGASARDRTGVDSAVRGKLEALELRGDAVANSAEGVVCPSEEYGCPDYDPAPHDPTEVGDDVGRHP